MAKSAKRTKVISEKRQRKEAKMKASGTSNYARKSAYLKRTGQFGFEVLVKPWK